MTDEPTMGNPFGMPEFEEGEDPVVEALRKIVATPEGRTFLWAVMSQAKVYDEVFCGNSTDTYDKGRRSMGLWIIHMLTELDPTVYPRMLLDVARQEQREQQRLADNSRNETYDRKG